MFRVSDLKDLPIYTLMGSRTFKYTVKSLLIDGFNNKIAAIVCKEGALKKSCRIIPYDKIISIDLNGIIISDIKCIKKIPVKDLMEFIQLENLINKTVRSNAGDLYGLITDIYINLLNGKITGYELSEGYIDDLVNGRKVFDLSESLDKALLKDEIVLYERPN